MRIDYTVICNLASEIGCRRDELIALSPGNDPFYVHVPNRREAAEWFANLWVALGFKAGSHLRRLHYNIISQEPAVTKPNGEPYRNVDNDWKLLITSSLAARYLRLIPDGALADHRNDPPIINAENTGFTMAACDIVGSHGAGLVHDIPDAEVQAPWLSVQTMRVPQSYLVELWVEKSTQNDILVPLASQMGFNLVSGAGETSETLARQTVERAVRDGRPMRILYVSDFDPGGRSMPVALARKIEFWLRDADLDLDIVLNPIVLTPEQCEKYRLPRTPLKMTERRAVRFEERFGSGATELDALEALHPGGLRRIVEFEVGRYLDPTLASRVHDANWSYKRLANKAEETVYSRYDISTMERRYIDLVEKFKSDVEALEEETEALWPQIAAELARFAPAFDPENLPAPRDATPPEAPLFDSKREYLDQIDHYHAWQGKGGPS